VCEVLIEKIYDNKRIYTGIGSRQTPSMICDLMKRVAALLYRKGYVLRSGAAHGADEAFESQVGNIFQKEIYLPWEWFNNHPSNLYKVSEQAKEIASKYHKHWNNLKPSTKLIMGRNVYQVLGLTLDNLSNFVVCCTVDGEFSGGTGLALRLAHDYKIPIFNLFFLNVRNNIFSLIDVVEKRIDAIK